MPLIDRKDWHNIDQGKQRRQFAPEYAQSVYKTMLSACSKSIGNYLGQHSEYVVSEEQRKHIVTLCQAINDQKEYKEDTLYLSVSLVDRYLRKL